MLQCSQKMKVEDFEMKTKIKCQCCGKIYSVHRFGTVDYTVCPNCHWEDDPFLENIFDESCANDDLTLHEARRNIMFSGDLYGRKPKWYQHKIKIYDYDLERGV